MLSLFRRTPKPKPDYGPSESDLNPASRVARGAKLLDRAQPGWEERIDTETLNIASIDRCVLGQLYGSYAKGMEKLSVSIYDHNSMRFSINHGFACAVDTHEWVRLVNKRNLARSA